MLLLLLLCWEIFLSAPFQHSQPAAQTQHKWNQLSAKRIRTGGIFASMFAKLLRFGLKLSWSADHLINSLFHSFPLYCNWMRFMFWFHFYFLLMFGLLISLPAGARCSSSPSWFLLDASLSFSLLSCNRGICKCLFKDILTLLVSLSITSWVIFRTELCRCLNFQRFIKHQHALNIPPYHEEDSITTMIVPSAPSHMMLGIRTAPWSSCVALQSLGLL